MQAVPGADTVGGLLAALVPAAMARWNWSTAPATAQASAAHGNPRQQPDAPAMDRARGGRLLTPSPAAPYGNRKSALERAMQLRRGIRFCDVLIRLFRVPP